MAAATFVAQKRPVRESWVAKGYLRIEIDYAEACVIRDDAYGHRGADPPMQRDAKPKARREALSSGKSESLPRPADKMRAPGVRCSTSRAATVTSA